MGLTRFFWQIGIVRFGAGSPPSGSKLPRHKSSRTSNPPMARFFRDWRIWKQAHGVKNLRRRFIVADLRFIK